MRPTRWSPRFESRSMPWRGAAEEAANGMLGGAKLGLLVAANGLIDALNAVDAEFARQNGPPIVGRPGLQPDREGSDPLISEFPQHLFNPLDDPTPSPCARVARAVLDSRRVARRLFSPACSRVFCCMPWPSPASDGPSGSRRAGRRSRRWRSPAVLPPRPPCSSSVGSNDRISPATRWPVKRPPSNKSRRTGGRSG